METRRNVSIKDRNFSGMRRESRGGESCTFSMDSTLDVEFGEGNLQDGSSSLRGELMCDSLREKGDPPKRERYQVWEFFPKGGGDRKI